MLSKKAWSVEGHDPGEKWTIKKIHQICQNVEVCGKEEKPNNVMREEKALKKKRDNDAKKELKEAKDDEEKYKKNFGKAQRNVVSKIEYIFSKKSHRETL
jgi:esterase/lipase